MTLTKSIRKRAAASVSSFEMPEQFHWHKWLRIGPAPEYYEIPPVFSRVMDTARLNKWLAAPGNQSYKAKMARVKLQKGTKKFFMAPVKTNAVYFSSGIPTIKKFELYGIDKIKFVYAVSIGEKDKQFQYIFENKEVRRVIYPEAEVKNIEGFEVYFKVQSFKKEFDRAVPDNKKIDFNTKAPVIKNLNLNGSTKVNIISGYQLAVPGIKDQLASLNTVVRNINILSKDDFKVSSSSARPKEYLKSFHKPKVYRAKKLQFYSETRSCQVKCLSAGPVSNVSLGGFHQAKPLKVNDIVTLSGKEILYISNTFEKLAAGADAGKFLTEKLDLHEKYDYYLKPEVKLGNDEYKEIFRNLYSYQEDSASFLLENKHGLICEQLGLGKTVELCAALRILYKTRECRSVLIVLPEESLGEKELSEDTGEALGWIGHLIKWFPESEPHIISGNRSERREKWQNTSLHNLVTYRQFNDDLSETLKDGKLLSRFDCIIVDEMQYLETEAVLNRLVRTVNPKNFWFTSSLPYNKLSETFGLDKITSTETGAVLNKRFERLKEEVTESIPDILRQDIWLDLDPEQQYEYNVALSNAKDQIAELYSSGNPYRFQAKVFFLLHQLKQISNFVGDNAYSPKGKLLLKQLDLILANKQKVLIFSQYDKFGTKMIENLLREKGVNYVTYLSGMTVPEMEKAIKSFRKDKEVPVLLAGLKAAGVRENIAEVPYVIHFDQWWNPVTHWQIENRVNHPEDKKIKVTNLNVYNYMTKNTFENKLKVKLAAKGLLVKNVIESLSAEAVTKLIRDDEWLEILGFVEKDEPRAQQLPKEYFAPLSIDQFTEKVKGFFTVLGYRNLEVERTPAQHRIVVKGTAAGKNKQLNAAAVCYTSDEVDAANIKEFLDKAQKSKEIDKIFVIVNGEYSIKSKLTLNKNVTFIEGSLFHNYIDEFQLI